MTVILLSLHIEKIQTMKTLKEDIVNKRINNKYVCVFNDVVSGLEVVDMLETISVIRVWEYIKSKMNLTDTMVTMDTVAREAGSKEALKHDTTTVFNKALKKLAKLDFIKEVSRNVFSVNPILAYRGKVSERIIGISIYYLDNHTSDIRTAFEKKHFSMAEMRTLLIDLPIQAAAVSAEVARMELMEM